VIQEARVIMDSGLRFMRKIDLECNPVRVAPMNTSSE
jgi:hypothetical protein